MTKSKTLHPRNPHNARYDFPSLIKGTPELEKFTSINKYGDTSIDFSNPQAVMVLNQALLFKFYKVKKWSIPKGHLCPPIPGRADYIHYIADLLDLKSEIKGLDIGTGTGCIYPLIGASAYDFNFVATDINPSSLESSKKIIDFNPYFKKRIELRHQKNSDHIFKNIILENEHYDFTMCNPPFHESLEDCLKGSERKKKNLQRNKEKKGHTQKLSKKALNFGGKNAELWCPGGELAFIKRMIIESVGYKTQCTLFTTLVSKKENLTELKSALKKVKASDIKTIEMKQGQKITRILTWRF